MANFFFTAYILSFLLKNAFNKDKKDDSRYRPYGIKDCSFKHKNNQIKCDLPTIKRKVVALTSPLVYGDTQFVNYKVDGQLECVGTLKESFGTDCDDFSVAVATGKVCNSPTRNDFDGLKNTVNSYCKTENNKFSCSAQNAKCPPRKSTSEPCCVVVRCNNSIRDCELKALVQFSLAGYLLPSTQRIPLFTEEIVAKGAGFDENSEVFINCFDEEGFNLGCQVKEVTKNALTLTFSEALAKTGGIYGLILSAKNDTSEQGDDAKVQIGTVVTGNWWEYRYYIGGGAAVLIFLFLLRKKNQPPQVYPSYPPMPPRPYY